MKRMLLTIAAIMATVLPMCAQGIANISVEARFITDKMITELRLAPSLYGTLLNLNGTYLRAIGGHRDISARCWHERNSALRRILSRAQWKAYRAAECFYRPIGWNGGAYVHRVYERYGRPTMLPPRGHWHKDMGPRPHKPGHHDGWHEGRPHHKGGGHHGHKGMRGPRH